MESITHVTNECPNFNQQFQPNRPSTLRIPVSPYPHITESSIAQKNRATQNHPAHAHHPVPYNLYTSLGAALQLRPLHLAERGSDGGQVPVIVPIHILW